MAEVSDVLLNLAAVERAIPGMITALEFAPDAVQPVQCPACVNLPDAMTPQVVGGEDGDSRMLAEEREYTILFLYAPFATGLIGQMFTAALPFLALMRNAMLAYTWFQLAGIEFNEYLGDEGLKVVTYQGDEFYGTRFRVKLTNYARVVYAAGE